MDTGAYMENQMSDQIEASQYFYEEFVDNLDKNITQFIKDCGYSWTFDEIVKEYKEKYSKGSYVSYTCKEVIKQFESDLSKI